MKIDGFWIGIAALVAVGGLILFSGGQGTPTPADDDVIPTKSDRIRACQQLTGERDARLASCLSQIGQLPLSSRASAEIAKMKSNGSVLVVGGSINVPEVSTTAFSLDSDYAAMMLHSDEAALASKLREDGVRGLVVSRDLTGAIDRDRTVLSRLAQHDFLEWFQLRHVTAEAFIYTVRSTPARVPVSTGDRMLKGLRARLEGRARPAQTWKPSQVRLIAAMRLQGRTLATRYEVTSDLERGLDDLAAKLRREWARKVEIYGHGTLDERLPEIRLDLHVVMENAFVEPRSRHSIFDLWEMGVDGMMFEQRDPRPGEKLDEKFTVMPGSEHIHYSFKSSDHFLRHAVSEGGWNDRRPWERDPRTKLQIIRTQHFMESQRGGGDAVRLFRAVPEEPMENLTDDSMRQMLVEGGDWWVHNMDEDGYTLYKYWPTQNRKSDDYNEVRHILAARDLSDTWRYSPRQTYLDHARKNMDWLLKYEVKDTDKPDPSLPHPPKGTMLFRYPFTNTEVRGKLANQKLGTVAVALLGWVEWAKATGSRAEDGRIKQMAQQGADPAGRTGARTSEDLLPGYVEHVHSFVDRSALAPLRVVADTANGMGGLVVPAVFDGLPFELDHLFPELDGTFPNHPADPIQPENQADLMARVLELDADVGLAFDGDADRVFLIDEQARAISGSLTTAMVARSILAGSPGATTRSSWSVGTWNVTGVFTASTSTSRQATRDSSSIAPVGDQTTSVTR